MKKLFSILIALTLVFALVACGKNDTPNNQPTSESNETEVSDSETSVSVNKSSATTGSASQSASNYQPLNAKKRIFLAGDSTVKTYNDNQYIGGWGQYLQWFLNEDEIGVVNKANGGRSSRSFINEGRLYTNTEIKTNFTSIESEIREGDYLFIQFGHNDDTSKDYYTNYCDRKVPIGEPDADNVYPTVVPEAKVPTTALPEEFVNSDYYKGLNSVSQNGLLSVIKAYGSEYYSFDCGGTFKGYLKMYIDFAREKGAIPVLCTPVARVKFDSEGTTLIGGAGRHGYNFEYVTAVRQLAKEEDCLLMDLFNDTKQMLEAVTVTDANYLMALKPNALTGEWPSGYDNAYDNKSAGYKGIEATHYNKYGAFLTAAKVAEHLKAFADENTTTSRKESVSFGDFILRQPISKITPSALMNAEKVSNLNALFTTLKVA